MQLVDATLEDLLAVASHASADTAKVMDDLQAFVREARDVWPEIAAAAPPMVRDGVTAHLAASGTIPWIRRRTAFAIEATRISLRLRWSSH